MGLLCWYWPGLMVAVFFGLSAWHWGSGDAPARARYRRQWLAHSLLCGALLFAVPLVFWPTDTGHLINELLGLGGAAPARFEAFSQLGALLWPVVLVRHWALWSSYFALGQKHLAGTDALEVLLLSLLLLALPPVLAGSVYSMFWHSLQHMLRMNKLVGRATTTSWPALGRELGFFLRRPRC